MIRYLLIIFFIFCNITYAEIIKINSGVIINIPENRTYFTVNALEQAKKNMDSWKFTAGEKKFLLNSYKKSGYSGNEKGYSIISQKRYENKLRQEDEFESL